MNKVIIAALLLSPVGMVYADYGQTSGQVSVQDVLNSGKDGQIVDLQGHLTKKLSGERYEFTDTTGGVIVVKIKTKEFPAGQAINETTPVEIAGELDTHWFGKPDVAVKQIHVMADAPANAQMGPAQAPNPRASAGAGGAQGAPQ